ncbi:MAG: hypothetical protein ACREPT_10815 [Rudaea sp.]
MTFQICASHALVPMFAIALAGCVSTIFESPPGTAASACDPRWVGNWDVQMANPKAQGDDKLVLRVGAQCKTLSVVENGNEQRDLDHAVLAFASIRGNRIAAFKLDPDSNGTKSKPAEWETGYHYFSYVANDGQIRLRQVDDERIAKLLIDGKLSGRTEKITRYPGASQPAESGTLHNFVAGTPQEMVHALATYPLFSDKSAIILKRIAAAPIEANPPAKALQKPVQP